MADKPKDAGAGWGEKLDGREDAPTPGNAKELVRQAMKLNPALRDQMSTADAMGVLGVAGQQRNVSTPAPTPARTATPKGSVAAGITSARERYQQHRTRLQGEIADLQKQLQQLAPEALETVLDVLDAADPNLTSPMTQEVLMLEAGFLGEVGFAPKKLVERQLKGRSKPK